MANPYKKKLEELKGGAVTIDRAGTTPLNGRVNEVEEDGCVVTTEGSDGSHDESSMFVFVAFKDIRGVGSVQWDYSKIH